MAINKICNAWEASGKKHLFRTNISSAQSNILLDRAGNEPWLLGHIANIFTDFRGVNLRDINPIKINRTFLHFKELGNQFTDGCFAGADPTHNRYPFTRIN